ncbi:hypothetical protein [Streptomyces collinus]|uniref:hypothetical protein n=1 Tax=Streptomyces collinus TaxID=42684 RepID=UPI0033FB4EFE
MPDFTLGDNNRDQADDMLDQMLADTHAEILTAIAIKQAGNKMQAPQLVRPLPDQYTPGEHILTARVAENEENGTVLSLARTLDLLRADSELLAFMTSDELYVVISHKFELVLKGLLRRSVSKPELLSLLRQLKFATDLTLERLENGHPDFLELGPVVDRIKNCLLQAHADVRHLFDPSDDAVRCPVSPVN